ncbi:hypothetical protein LXL04_000838 [Taraxacum kok-saghyz]
MSSLNFAQPFSWSNRLPLANFTYHTTLKSLPAANSPKSENSPTWHSLPLQTLPTIPTSLTSITYGWQLRWVGVRGSWVRGLASQKVSTQPNPYNYTGWWVHGSWVQGLETKTQPNLYNPFNYMGSRFANDLQPMGFRWWREWALEKEAIVGHHRFLTRSNTNKYLIGKLLCIILRDLVKVHMVNSLQM